MRQNERENNTVVFKKENKEGERENVRRRKHIEIELYALYALLI